MCEGHGRWPSAGLWGAARQPPGPWAYRAAACTAGSGSRTEVCAGAEPAAWGWAEGGCLQVGFGPPGAGRTAPLCAGRAAARGVPSWLSSLGASRAARPGRALSCRPSNLKHAGLPAPARPAGPEGRREGTKTRGGGARGPLGARGPGAAEPGDPRAPLPGGRRAQTD